MGNITRRKAIGGALCLLLATRICVLSRKEAASGAITNIQSNATQSRHRVLDQKLYYSAISIN